MRQQAEARLEPVRQAAFDAGYQAARAELVEQAEFADLEETRKSDPIAWAAMFDDPKELARIRRYEAFKAKEQAQTDQPTGLMARAEGMLAAASAVVPDIQQRLASREQGQPGRYSPTAIGMQNLDADLKELLAQARNGQLRGGTDPATQQATRREQAATKRAALPKPSGAPAAPASTVQSFSSPAAALAAGLREAAKSR
jgi:hypothetical protein